MQKHLILGTAGHIDHGKTSLVRALTGIDTDRLPEEKKRGITIELGYAYLDVGPFRLGIVDVPGHEKFIRQMLSGATAMDLAMLVVAADDSVKQQTREHLDILRMLDLAAGIIVITKADLVDAQWLDLVRDELQELVKGTVFESAEVVSTSVKTMSGIDQLKGALLRASEISFERSITRASLAPFRLPIDRTFTMEGFGTVVTGSVVSGTAKVGDPVTVHPLNLEVRIRGLQSHDQLVETVHRGQRAAVNLAGIHHEELSRGLELAAPGYLRPSQIMTLELLLLPQLKKPLKDRTKVRFHLGTAEILGVVRFLSQPELKPGEKAFAQIYLDEPAVASWNQAFVIRQESPMTTFGGGRILDPHAKPLKRPTEQDVEFVKMLGSQDPATRCEAAAFVDDSFEWNPSELPASTGTFAYQDIVRELVTGGRLIELPISASRIVNIHRERFLQLAEQIRHALKKMHEANPLRLHFDVSDLVAKVSFLGPPEVLQAAIRAEVAAKNMTINANLVALEGYGPKLSKAEQQLLPELVERFRSAGLKAPTEKELLVLYAKRKDVVPQLLRLAQETGDLTLIGDGIFLHREAIAAAMATLKVAFAKRDALTVSDIREILDTTRKYAVPLCEYFDKSGFTVRQGDTRRLG